MGEEMVCTEKLTRVACRNCLRRAYKTKETVKNGSLFFITHLIFIIQLFFDREELERQVDQIAEVLTLVEHVLIILLVIPMNFNIGSRIEKSV